MRRRISLALALTVLAGVALVGTVNATEVEVGLPATVVDFTPDHIRTTSYPTTDYSDPEAPEGRQTTTDWRVVMGTGNAAELWLTVSKEGRLFDLGGRYINYTDDKGLTWKSVRPAEPLANAEGSVVMAPNGDVLGVTWDPYSGDRVITYKYNAAEQKWYYNYNPIHTPFWDRPGIDIVPGPFTTPLGTVPYITFINGLPHDPWYYSTDGLNYYNVSGMQVDEMTTTDIQAPLNIQADPSFDWIQPNTYFPFTALGGGRALNGLGHIFMPEDMKWHAYDTPPDVEIKGDMHSDSLGRLHSITRHSGGFSYEISTDEGQTWNELSIDNGESPGDFRANASVGVAAVWALKGKKDIVYKFDITGDTPVLLARYEVGLGDDTRSGGIGFYGATGGHRFDFPTLVIFPDGKVAISYMDSTTHMPFPSLGLDVVAPGLAVEMDTAPAPTEP